MRPGLFSLHWHQLTALVALLGLCGGSACSRLQAAPPPADIRVQVPTTGLSTFEVETQVTSSIERALLGIAGLTHLRSSSSAEGSQLVLTLGRGAPLFKLRQAALTALQNAAVPSGVYPELEPLRAQVIYRYTIEAPHLTMSELLSLQELHITRALMRVPGVADVTHCGGEPRRVEVTVDRPRLASRGLGPSEVASALRTALLDSAPLGLRAASPSTSPAELQKLTIAERAGTLIRLGDVATIRVDAPPPRCLAGRDKRSAVLAAQVWLRQGDDAQQVQAAVRAQLMQLRSELPPGVLVADFATVPRPPESPMKARLQRAVRRVFADDSPAVLRVRLVLPGEPRAPAMQSLSQGLRELAAQLPEVESALTLAHLRDSLADHAAAGEVELLLTLRPGPAGRTLTSLLSELVTRIAQLPEKCSELDIHIESSLGLWPASAPRPLGLRLHGPDLAQLAQLAERLRVLLSALPVMKVIRVEGARQRPQLRVTIDRAAILRYSIGSEDVRSAIAQATTGDHLGVLLQGEQRLAVVLRTADAAEPKDLQTTLQGVMVKGHGEAAVPLLALTNVTMESTPAEILREDNQRCVLLRIMAPTLDSKQILQLSQERARELQLPVGTALTWEPELEE